MAVLCLQSRSLFLKRLSVNRKNCQSFYFSFYLIFFCFKVVQNSAVEAVLKHCPHLKHIHCNTCPNLTDLDLASAIGNPSPFSRTESPLECFYIYESPGLTVNAFELLVDSFPRYLKQNRFRS